MNTLPPAFTSERYEPELFVNRQSGVCKQTPDALWRVIDGRGKRSEVDGVSGPKKIVPGLAPGRGGLFPLSQLLDEDFALMVHPFDCHLNMIFLRGLLE